MSEEQDKDNKTASPPPVPAGGAGDAGQPAQDMTTVEKPVAPEPKTAQENEAEEPVFPIEEFVGGSSEKDTTEINTSQSLPAPATTPQSPAPQPPPVPKSGSPSTYSPKKSGIFGFFSRKQKSPPTPQVGQRAVIKRESSAGKIIIWALFILVLLGVVFYLFFYKVTVNIAIDPAPDSVSIDGGKVELGSHKLAPGFHEIRIEKAGYVSYYKSREFKMGEKVDLKFSLQKATAGNPEFAGAKSLSLSASSKYINAIGPDSRLYSIALEEENAEPIALSLEQFSPIRQVAFSSENNYALILDQEALKIADFAKLDPTSPEKPVALPPAASAVSSFSWNNKASSYVGTANSKIVYDLKTSSGWDLFLMDMASKHSQVLMQIDPARYQNLSVDWGDSDKTILLVGNEAGVLDLGTREYTAIEQNGGFTSGKWGPSGKTAVLIKNDSQAYHLKDGKAVDLKVNAKIFSFKSANEAYFIEQEKIVLINFDSGSRINYAEISGLKNAVSFAVSKDKVYFLDNTGIKSAKLQEGAYEGQTQR